VCVTERCAVPRAYDAHDCGGPAVQPPAAWGWGPRRIGPPSGTPESRTPPAAWEGSAWEWDCRRLGARAYRLRVAELRQGLGVGVGVARGLQVTGLCCFALPLLGLGVGPAKFRVKWVLRVPRMNTRLGPNLIRVFSFVTRWSCSGNGSRAKWVRVWVIWVTGFGLGFYAQSYSRCISCTRADDIRDTPKSTESSARNSSATKLLSVSSDEA
jgi:hypothetical protein